MLQLRLQQVTKNVLKLIKYCLFVYSIHLNVQNL
jgi:hypothetical protein